MAGLWIAAAAAGLLPVLAWVCFRLVFYTRRTPSQPSREVETPSGSAYDPYREQMIRWTLQARAMPRREMSVQSFDGLTLRGYFYEYAPGAPIELMLHGYRGTSERDLSGGVQRCFMLGHSALIVDQRGCGRSEGSVITFGLRESRDCRVWLEHLVALFGPDTRVLLTGISMGASTVLQAAGEALPPQAVGVLADCGFTTAPDIIRDVMGKLRLPAAVLYPFVALGARLFGGFDLRRADAARALERCTLPVIFFHGEADGYVPCSMSRENFRRCASPRKRLITVPGADHGLSYPADPRRYLRELRDFFGPELCPGGEELQA